MGMLKQYRLWVSILVGIVLFAVTYPFYHDIYIAKLHSCICVCLNAFSSVLFCAFLYCAWQKRLCSDNMTIFLWFTVLQAIAHGIFAVMNWGSFLFLALSIIVFIVLALSFFKEKSK